MPDEPDSRATRTHSEEPELPAPARSGRPIARRDVLRAGVFGAAALVLARCSPAPASPLPTPPGSSASSSPARSSDASPITSPSVEPEPSPSPTATPDPPLREAIAGLLVVGFRGARLSDAPWLRTALAETGLGGVVLFDRDQLTGGPRNVVSPTQVAALTRDLRAAAGSRPILVAVDQEGGVVTRLSPAHGFPAVASEAAIGRSSLATARTWARGIAATLAAAGIDLNLAPVVDLDVNPDSPAIGALDRSFSADPDVVVSRATIEVDAHRAAGIRTALKHFPGIGSSTSNTDFGVSDVTATWTRAELEPFRRLITAGRADLVMAGHVVNRRLDAAHPASLSPAIVGDLLRGELGWDGTVVTDDLQAAAITRAFGRDDAVLLALEAGCDVLLFANQQAYDAGVVDRVVEVVARAVETGRLPEERVRQAWRRVQRTLAGA